MDKQEFLQKYIVERRGTDSMKWDGLEGKFGAGEKDLLAMWVADMEFKTCDAVVEAMVDRSRHGVFGYSIVPEAYYTINFKYFKPPEIPINSEKFKI